MAKMCTTAGKTKPSSLSPFLFHLYHSLDLLRNRERSTYKVVEVMLQYSISPEPKGEGTKEGSEGESSDPEKEKVVTRGKGKELAKRLERKGPIWALERKDDPLSKVIEDLKGIRDNLASEKGWVQIRGEEVRRVS